MLSEYLETIQPAIIYFGALWALGITCGVVLACVLNFIEYRRERNDRTPSGLPKTLFALAAVLLFASQADACHRCGYSSCYGGCAVQQSYADDGIILKADGTYWRDGVEQERVRVSSHYSKTGWVWSFAPKSRAARANRVPFALQGNTVYGYEETATYGQNYQGFAAAYQTDPALFMNQAFRLQQQAQDAASKGYSTFAPLAAQLTAQSQDNAKTVALLQAFSQGLAATNPSVVKRSASLRQELGQSAGQDAAPVRAFSRSAAVSRELAGSLQGRCAACHSGESPKGGLDLTPEGAASLDADAWEVICERLTTSDPQKHMPKADDGEPLIVLPVAELALYMQQWAAMKGN